MSVDEIKHPSVRECLKFLNIEDGIEMVHTSDLPAQSGVGSSSSFTVGFLNALYALKGKIVGKRQLALESIHVEQDRIKESIGSQDQAAVAFGGFNMISFGGEEKISVKPLTIKTEKLNFLQDNLMLFFTGFSRTASEIASEQIRLTPSRKNELSRMKEMVDHAIEVLNGPQEGISDLGRLIHESWLLKRSLSSRVSTKEIDEIYESACSAGASGGKLLGAGGGGFMLIFAPGHAQAKIKEKLKKLLYVPFRFENLGSQVVFYSPEEAWG
jgi:D-glycero-alpha-D-manno-heptose-7-phosphate kinase